MDTMKLLLGATVALLLGALAMSYNGMKQGIANAPAEERQKQSLEIEQLKLEVEKLKLEREKSTQDLPPRATPVPVLPPTTQVPTDSELADLKAQLEQKEAALKALEGDKNKAERNAKMSDQENLLLAQRDIEKKDPEFRRAKLISQALLVAKVKSYEENPESGDFVILDIVMPEQVPVGSILSIRKNSGILGQLKVTSIDPEGAIASPLPGFGAVKPQPGDELIVPPPF